MAIDFKAKKPVPGGLKLRFVRLSGQALTQGVENIRIDGVPVRIYSAAKTIADCLKYRKKLGGNLAVKVLRESIDRRKCSEQRLRHFARICRVRKIGSRRILFGRESISFRELADKSNTHIQQMAAVC